MTLFCRPPLADVRSSTARCGPLSGRLHLAGRVCSLTRSGNANSLCTNRRLPLQSDQPAYTECRLQRYGEISMTKADENAIRDIELRFNEAWGRHDADGMVESLTDDAQFVTVNGAWTTNRADYLDLMQRLHGADGPFRLSTRETPEMHLRFLAPDIAMMHSRFHIHGDIDESVRVGIGTRVVHKIGGRWRTVAVQNTDVRAGRRH
jgi:uncharacterized protein (TIGR02246 family)